MNSIRSRGEAKAGSPAFGVSKPCRNRLRLGVVFQDFLAHLAAPAGLLISSKWPGRIPIIVGVDADGARPDLAGHHVSNFQVLRPDARLQAVLGIISEPR